ncbi:MAG: urea ABC transporter permease subunit UrtB [Synechococcaceae cyanobacterium SM2_3_1]|nr:urea ABC transporter permease subunit UrtB [Synechococcaceae cyanobacterium SM2_3_1]
MLGSIITGLSIGSIFLLVALGLTVIYGSMGVINMAHGELIMLGAYGAVFAEKYLSIPFLLCLPLAFMITGFIGMLMEVLIVKPLYHRLQDTLLATWGVGIVIQQIIRLTFGPGLQNLTVPEYLINQVQVFGLSLQPFRISIFLLSLILVGLVVFLLFRTDFGTQLRAVTQNAEISACNGINVNRVKSLTFALGSGLAGIAGVMLGGLKNVSPTMGTPYVVDAFITVVVGGVSSLVGTVASAGVLGQINAIVAWLSNDVLAKAALFGLTIIIIRFRPNGLFAFKGR